MSGNCLPVATERFSGGIDGKDREGIFRKGQIHYRPVVYEQPSSGLRDDSWLPVSPEHCFWQASSLSGHSGYRKPRRSSFSPRTLLRLVLPKKCLSGCGKPVAPLAAEVSPSRFGDRWTNNDRCWLPDPSYHHHVEEPSWKFGGAMMSRGERALHRRKAAMECWSLRTSDRRDQLESCRCPSRSRIVIHATAVRHDDGFASDKGLKRRGLALPGAVVVRFTQVVLVG